MARPFLFALLALLLCAASARADVRSDFTGDAEGWTVFRPDLQTLPAVHHAGVGNPPGSISTTGLCSNRCYLTSGAEYEGFRLNAYGTRLSFELGSPPALSGAGDAVVLNGGGLTFVHPLPLARHRDPTGWEAFTFALDTAGGWTNGQTGMAVSTQQEFEQLLSSFESIQVRGDNEVWLDNVRFGPETDLAITAIPSRPDYRVGETISWTVKVANESPVDTAQGIIVAIPSAQEWNVTGAGCFVEIPEENWCDVGDIPAGTSKSLTLSKAATAIGPVPLDAKILNAGDDDPDHSDNTVKTSTQVKEFAADLGVSVTGPAQVAPGARVEFSVDVRNDGPDTAKVIRLGLAPSSGPADIVAPAGSTCTSAPTGFVCDAPDAATGPVGTWKVAWTARPNGQESLAAAVSSDVGDPDASDDGTAAVVPIVAPAQPTPTPTPTPTPEPEVAETGVQFVFSRLSGTVLIRRSDGTFERLQPGEVIPDGAELDTRKGALTITVRRGDGALETVRFFEGRFRIDQDASGKLTTVQLRGGSFASCPRLRPGRASAAARKRVVRKLWGDGTGRFRTQGRHAAATVRGTKWLVEDRCGETYVRVVRGRVDVRSARGGKTYRIRAGRSIIIPSKGPVKLGG